MVIIFYDAQNEKIYICTEYDKMKSFEPNDPDLISYIPNDDILYVQNAHFITKQQFTEWIQGNNTLLDTVPEQNNAIQNSNSETAPAITQPPTYANSAWIHPAHHGAILLPDVKNSQFPEGVALNGKWDFLPVDALGGFEILEESMHYRSLLAKGKIEVVDYEYVKKNRSKNKRVSAVDAALDSIIVKDATPGSAMNVAALGGLNPSSDSGAVEILIES